MQPPKSVKMHNKVININNDESFDKPNLIWKTQNNEKAKYKNPNKLYDFFFDILYHSKEEIKKTTVSMKLKKYDPFIMQ